MIMVKVFCAGTCFGATGKVRALEQQRKLRRSSWVIFMWDFQLASTDVVSTLSVVALMEIPEPPPNPNMNVTTWMLLRSTAKEQLLPDIRVKLKQRASKESCQVDLQVAASLDRLFCFWCLRGRMSLSLLHINLCEA